MALLMRNAGHASQYWRRMVPGAWALLAILLTLTLSPASAHTRSESFLLAEVDQSTVRVQLTLPDPEAARLAAPGSGAPGDARLEAYFNRQLTVSAGAVLCPAGAGARALSAARGFRRLELTFRCPADQPMTLRSNAFFDIVPSHLTFARIRVLHNGAASFTEQLIDSDRRDLPLGGDAAGGMLQNASFIEYIKLGIEHILTGPDHLAFVLGFVLISRRWRDLALVITGFTLGHSVTLGLAVTGLLAPQADFINTMIALTIALIGAENFVVATRRPVPIAVGAALLLVAMTGLRLAGVGLLPTPLLAGSALFAFCYLMMSGQLRDGGKLRLVITLIFGLIHGFAFAKDLIDMQLPTGRLAELLFGFNLGVETGQLLVVGILILSARLLVRLRLAPPRALVVDTFSAGLVGLGLCWLVGRTYA